MPGIAAFKILFHRAGESGSPELPAGRFLRQLGNLLNAGDTALQLNCLAREMDGAMLAEKFLGEVFEAFVTSGVLPGELAGGKFSANAEFLLNNFMTLCRELKKCTASADCQMLMPSAAELFDALPEFTGTAEAAAMIVNADPFRTHRVFSCHRGNFVPVEPSSVKPVEKFFGFPGVRLAFAEHFHNFAAGKTSLPLLINSLPGYGKTSMVISFALAEPDTVVILPDPDALEDGWNTLISSLAARRDHRFVLFFDDIDPRSVNWYNFRTNVGGAFTPPGNIMPVLAANYEFPPSILSRGRRISYPVFDEERCMEMIEDFLCTFGMKTPPRNIVSLMGAEYTEEFGQKKFTELSPRTLMRHLKLYENDPRKRKQIVELSGGGMITRPDAELFYEFNIELMRSLYGEEYIQRLLKERLKSL